MARFYLTAGSHSSHTPYIWICRYISCYIHTYLSISYLAGVLVLLAVIPAVRRVPAPIGIGETVAAHVVQAETYTIHILLSVWAI
jgi:hypothetical protein